MPRSAAPKQWYRWPGRWPLDQTVLGDCARCGSIERLKFCSRCQAVRYCGSDCQNADVSGGFGGGREGVFFRGCIIHSSLSIIHTVLQHVDDSCYRCMRAARRVRWAYLGLPPPTVVSESAQMSLPLINQ